ncbi:hypothetical protein ACFPAF_16560 [Hymenobacter endophyticus]|uniref:Uncharacterized protein n=1 Tax=Hymenobacter endophyticus TaxID=3076335 RepID=A0ABU3TKW4_9BACT|nr:hypothetical protein [Hymenobacter endophyticus]MDU0372017.1 hypothetical protein [Hymenobacter endophyticus]
MTTDYSSALEAMQRVLAAFPTAWEQARRFRRQQGTGIPAWPAWCFLPIAGSYAIVSKGGNMRPAAAMAIAPVAVALAWWPTKAVFLFDKPLLNALVDQHTPQDVPVEKLLNNLPKWGGYVDLMQAEKLNAAGFWWHLEADANKQNRPELRLLVHQNDGTLLPLPLILGSDPKQGVREILQSALQVAHKAGVDMPIQMGAVAGMTQLIAPLLNILLYLSSEPAQIEPAVNPSPSTMPEPGPVVHTVS